MATAPVPTAPLYVWGDATGDTGIGTLDEALALVADGILPADGLTFRSETSDRTFRIEYRRSLYRDWPGFDWRLYTTGHGRSCVADDGFGNPHNSGTFRSAADAIREGEAWVAMGGWLPHRERSESAAPAYAEAAE